jgi:hypothetical protein
MVMILEHNERQIDASTLLRINVYEGYDFDNQPGHIHYEICEYQYTLWYQPDGYTYAKPVIESGTLPLTLQLVSQWGADDQPIFDYVMQELGL